MCQLQVAWCQTLAATSFQHAAPLQHVALCCVSETQATSVVSGPLGVFGSNGWVAGCKRVKWAGNYCHPCASTTKWWTYASTSTPSSRRPWWKKNMEWEGAIKNHLCDVQFCAVFASSFSIWIFPLIARHACHTWATSHVWHVQLDGSSRCFCHKKSRTTSWTYALPFGCVSKSACDKVQFMVNMCHHFFLAPIPHLSLPYKVPEAAQERFPAGGKNRWQYMPSALWVYCLDTCCPDVQSYLFMF